MVIDLFGYPIDLAILRIPVGVAIAAIALVLLFFLTSKVMKFALIVIFVVACGLILYWAFQHYGIIWS